MRFVAVAIRAAGAWMRLVALLTVVALLFAGCGGENEANGGSATDGVPPSTQVRTATQPEESEDAVTDTIATWLLEGKCELMTDKFLEAQTSGIGDNRRERCRFFRDLFSKPVYTENDIKFSNVKIVGVTATATVGDYNTNITSVFKLVAEDGKWRIDEAS